MSVRNISLFALASLVILWLAQPIFVPIMIALLLTQLLSPLVRRLERKMPSFAAIMLSMGLVMLVLVATIALIGDQLSILQTSLPEMAQRISQLVEGTVADLGKYTGMARKSQAELVRKSVETSLATGGVAMMGALSFTIATLAETALVMILAVLMLYYRFHFRRQLKRIGEAHGAAIGTAMDNVVELAQRYVAGLGIVMTIVGVADTLVLLLIGAPFAAVFGVLGALSVLVPYVGVAVVAPTCAAITWLATGSGELSGAVLLTFVLIHFVEGNIISPYLVGSKVNLNPLATMLAIMLGGFMWGPAGMVLFIPMFGVLKLALDATSDADPYARLLGSVTAEDLGRESRLRFLRRRRPPAPVAASAGTGILLACLVVASFGLGGCITVKVGGDGKNEPAFDVAEPREDWVKLDEVAAGVTRAYRSRDSGAVLGISTACDSAVEMGFEPLLEQMTTTVPERVVVQASTPVESSVLPSRYMRVTGRYDDQPVEMLTVVLKSEACVYDLTLTGRSLSEAERAEALRLAAGLRERRTI